MPKNTQWFQKDDLDREAINKILPCNISVDIGTGIKPHDFINAAICICCEPFAEYFNILKHKVEDKIDKIYFVEQKTWAEALDYFSNKSVDTVFLIDVIEHLTKEEGEFLLRRTEEIARQQIVIFTPLGFVAQHTLEGGKDAWGLNGAEWQEHKSGWLPDDFDDSWDVYACKDYHDHSNIGNKLDKPFGAFWSIKTFSDNSEFKEEKVCLDIYHAIRNLINKLERYKNDIDMNTSITNELKRELEIVKSQYRDLENSRPIRMARFLRKTIGR